MHLAEREARRDEIRSPAYCLCEINASLLRAPDQHVRATEVVQGRRIIGSQPQNLLERGNGTLKISAVQQECGFADMGIDVSRGFPQDRLVQRHRLRRLMLCEEGFDDKLLVNMLLFRKGADAFFELPY